MKRSWLGLCLLLVLLFSSLIASWAMVEIHEEAAEKLEDAADLALAGNWAGAAFLAANVRRTWEQWELLRSALADHGPMEEIDAAFSVLEVYGASRERVAFAAVCRDTAKKMEAMGDAHSLSLKNLL